MGELPETRSAAKEAGSLHYFTGLECTRGHVDIRYTSSGTCKTCLLEDYRKRYKENPKEYRERSRTLSNEKYKSDEDYKRKKVASIKSWQQKNPDKVRTYKQNNKHMRRQIERKGITGRQLSQWKEVAEKICYWCGEHCKESFHVDHYIPLSAGGEHETDNLVIACPPCNLSKQSKDPYEFAQAVGRLF